MYSRLMSRKLSSKSLAVVIALGLVTAVFAGAVVSEDAGAQTTNDSKDRHISVSAGGDAEGSPDKVVVRVEVTARSESSNQAREWVAENASRMTAALMDAGIDEDNITTERFDIREERRVSRPVEGQPKKEEREFVAEHTYRIETSNVSGAGNVVDVAVSNGANEVQDVSFTLSDEKRRSLKGTALKKAMENARSQAEAVGDAGDLSITGVRSVNTQDVGFSPVKYDSMEMARAGGGSNTEIMSGPVSVNANVNVVYDVR